MIGPGFAERLGARAGRWLFVAAIVVLIVGAALGFVVGLV